MSVTPPPDWVQIAPGPWPVLVYVGPRGDASMVVISDDVVNLPAMPWRQRAMIRAMCERVLARLDSAGET